MSGGGGSTGDCPAVLPLSLVKGNTVPPFGESKHFHSDSAGSVGDEIPEGTGKETNTPFLPHKRARLSSGGSSPSDRDPLSTLHVQQLYRNLGDLGKQWEACGQRERTASQGVQLASFSSLGQSVGGTRVDPEALPSELKEELGSRNLAPIERNHRSTDQTPSKLLENSSSFVPSPGSNRRGERGKIPSAAGSDRQSEIVCGLNPPSPTKMNELSSVLDAEVGEGEAKTSASPIPNRGPAVTVHGKALKAIRRELHFSKVESDGSCASSAQSAATTAAASLPNVPTRSAAESPQKSSTRSKQTAPSIIAKVEVAGPGNTKVRDGGIKVVVRKRPLVVGEAGKDCISVSSPQLTVEVTKQRVDLSEYTQKSEFSFDEVFGEEVHNQTVHLSCATELLDLAMSGGSASCFAYGQTGSGKTHTMMGTSDEQGLYLLAASDLFGRLGPTQHLDVSFYEIYCNSLFDLLNERNTVVLREGGDRKINVCGLTWHEVHSTEEMWALISAGMEHRRTGSTSANEQSSRSHAVLSIRIKDTENLDFSGIVNFVDLAGSERAADTANNEKQARLEGAEINKSLLALKECIRALDEHKKHVPFRGSRLTEVLRDSFTGNSKTVMIATISPSSTNFEHTLNTLRYAFRVKGLSVPIIDPDKARNAPRPYAVPCGGRVRSRTSEVLRSGQPPLNENPWNSSVAVDATSHNPIPSGLSHSTRPSRLSRSHLGKRPSHSLSPPHGRDEGQQLQAPANLFKNVSQTTPYGTASPLSLLPNGASEYPPQGPLKGSLRTPKKRSASSHGGEKRRMDESRLDSGLPSSSSPLLGGNVAHSFSATEAGKGRWQATMGDRTGAVPSPELSFCSHTTARTTREEYEEELRRSVVKKVQRDLGREIQFVLDERDKLIAKLRRENDELKRAIEDIRVNQQGGEQLLPGILHHTTATSPADEEHTPPTLLAPLSKVPSRGHNLSALEESEI